MLYVLYALVALLLLETIAAFFIEDSKLLKNMVKGTACALFVVGVAILLSGSKPSEPTTYTETEIRAALTHIIEGKLTRTDPDYEALSMSFSAAQQEFKIPALLLVSMGRYESEYRTNVRGKRGEIGILQVGKQGRRRCRQYCGRNKTEYEQIMCGGCWLRENVKWCKTLEKGLTAYACGKCKPTNARTRNAVQRRFNLWYRLHDRSAKNEIPLQSKGVRRRDTRDRMFWKSDRGRFGLRTGSRVYGRNNTM